MNAPEIFKGPGKLDLGCSVAKGGRSLHREERITCKNLHCPWQAFNCPNEIPSVFIFPEDHISIQMLHFYFMTVLLSSDALKDLQVSTCFFVTEPTLLYAVGHGLVTPVQP